MISSGQNAEMPAKPMPVATISHAAPSSGQQDEEDNTPVKIDTLLFTIPLTVSDRKGTSIAGLKKENFTIYEDGLSQDIELF